LHVAVFETPSAGAFVERQRSEVRVRLPTVSDDALETLLEQWSAWARGARIRYGRCGSAEGSYLPERVADDQARQPKIRPFREYELLACERAVTALPGPFRVLTVYVWLRNFRRSLRCAARTCARPASRAGHAPSGDVRPSSAAARVSG
jgi:hypothetical protein